MKGITMQDSGSRNTFETGAVRDDGEKKPRPDLVSPFSLMRLGEWLRKGAEKYDERNWEKGMPISRCLEAIDRHFLKYQMRQTDEDHMAAVMCNAMFIMHYEEMIKKGVLTKALDDRGDYSPRIPVFPYLKGINMGQKMLQAGDAVCYIQSETMDADYGLELKSQDQEVHGLNPMLKDMSTYGQVHKPLSAMGKKPNCFVEPKNDVSGMMKQIQDVFVLPDENMCDRVRDPYKGKRVPTCDICGTVHDIKYYRLDLDRSYCTLCYINNRIDLKPVIIWS
jgi:hypothetical protein